MIAYCPNCKGKLKPSGGVRLCTQCKGKYYILETHDPLVTISEKTGTEVNIKAVENLLLTYSSEGDLEFWREQIGYSLSDIKEKKLTLINMKVKSFTVYFEIFGHKKKFTIESTEVNSQSEAEKYVRDVLIPKSTTIFQINTNEEKTINKKDYDELWEEFDKTFDKIGKSIDAVFEKANKVLNNVTKNKPSDK